MDNKKVLNKIISQVRPILKGAGYRKVSTRTFNCVKEDGLIHIVNFQASQYGDEFTINVAVYVRELRKGFTYKLDEKRVEEDDCTIKLRWRISQIVPKIKHSDYWWSYKSPEKSAKQIKTYLTDYVLPYLEKYSSRSFMHKRKGQVKPKKK